MWPAAYAIGGPTCTVKTVESLTPHFRRITFTDDPAVAAEVARILDGWNLLAEARIDIARKFVGFGDDRFERCSNECIAVRLAAR